MDKIKDLIELLSEEELAFFNTLAPSYQKNFANHAFSAKREETRLKNQDEVKEALEMKCKNIFEYKKKKNPRPNANPNLTEQEKLDLYFEKVEDLANRQKLIKLYNDIVVIDENLTKLYAWNQPMIKYNETFICALSVAKNHFSLAFEAETLDVFKDEFVNAGFELMKKGVKTKYSTEIDFELIKKAVLFTIDIKKDAKGFWS